MITRDEWLRALGDAVQPVDPDALTVKDMAEQFGVGRHKALARINALIAEGKAVRVFKIVTRANGAPYRAAAYKLLPSKPTPRRAAR
jgi:hypothetical protein